mmetsp:Transcript_96697/g.166696  ORF Transcript_96697/g.166696 Transcript_96697/m.166696 type:complete len:388 (-) Transcript_96697:205-1368(-)
MMMLWGVLLLGLLVPPGCRGGTGSRAQAETCRPEVRYLQLHRPSIPHQEWMVIKTASTVPIGNLYDILCKAYSLAAYWQLPLYIDFHPFHRALLRPHRFDWVWPRPRRQWHLQRYGANGTSGSATDLEYICISPETPVTVHLLNQTDRGPRQGTPWEAMWTPQVPPRQVCGAPPTPPHPAAASYDGSQRQRSCFWDMYFQPTPRLDAQYRQLRRPTVGEDTPYALLHIRTFAGQEHKMDTHNNSNQPHIVHSSLSPEELCAGFLEALYWALQTHPFRLPVGQMPVYVATNDAGVARVCRRYPFVSVTNLSGQVGRMNTNLFPTQEGWMSSVLDWLLMRDSAVLVHTWSSMVYGAVDADDWLHTHPRQSVVKKGPGPVVSIRKSNLRE